MSMKTEGKASVQPVYTRESCHPSLIGSSKHNKEILTTWHYRPAQRLQNTAAHPPPGHKLLCANATDHAFAASAWHTTRRCCCRYSVKGFNCSGANVSGCAAVDDKAPPSQNKTQLKERRAILQVALPLQRLDLQLVSLSQVKRIQTI